MNGSSILVFGHEGQVGSALMRLGAGRGATMTGHDLPGLDVTDRRAVDEAVARVCPDFVINAAAYNAVDGAEDDVETAMAVNAFAPGYIALSARRAGARFVHYSTDYVFDGRKEGPYVETDAPCPVSAYGRSKLAGENAALVPDPGNLVLRTAWVFSYGGDNFVTRLAARLEGTREFSFVDDSWGTPTFADDLASVTLDLLEAGADGGIYHAAGTDVATPYEWALAALDRLAPDALVAPVSQRDLNMKAERPVRSVMENARLAGLGMSMPGGMSRMEGFERPGERTDR